MGVMMPFSHVQTWKRTLVIMERATASAVFAPQSAPRFAQGTSEELPPETLVMGLRPGDEDRAYPLRLLAFHQFKRFSEAQTQGAPADWVARFPTESSLTEPSTGCETPEGSGPEMAPAYSPPHPLQQVRLPNVLAHASI